MKTTFGFWVCCADVGASAAVTAKAEEAPSKARRDTSMRTPVGQFGQCGCRHYSAGAAERAMCFRQAQQSAIASMTGSGHRPKFSLGANLVGTTSDSRHR